MTSNNKIARAMAEQVDRVNERTAADPEEEIRRLRAEIAKLKQRIDEQQLYIETLTGDVPAKPQASGKMLNGRRVITISEAAAAMIYHGSSKPGARYAAAWREVKAGRWEAIKDAGVWMVYADQSLVAGKGRGRSGRKNKRLQ